MNSVLIIEDERSIADLYKIKLEIHDFLVKIAENGLEGLKVLENFKPDIILLDLKMPVMDGEKFLEKLRKTNKETPVVILTNVSKEEAPATLWHHGISDYFIKAHFTPTELVNIIEKIIK